MFYVAFFFPFKFRANLGQGIRTGGGCVVPITGPAGLQTNDRRSSGSLRVSFLALKKTF